MAGAVSLERQAVVDLLILRARWLDAVAFDRRLSAAEARIGMGAFIPVILSKNAPP
jgi:hypothetical protein